MSSRVTVQSALAALMTKKAIVKLNKVLAGSLCAGFLSVPGVLAETAMDLPLNEKITFRP